MRLLLIRHGQTPANVRGELSTVAPGPGLTELGRAQAAAIPDALTAERIDGIYVSRLARTQQTAAPLARVRHEMHRVVMPGLHEIVAGDLEGRTDKESVTAYLTTARAWGGGNLDVTMPGSEDGHEFFGRFDADIEAIAAEHTADHTVAVFSHGAAIRVWTAGRVTNMETDYPDRHHLENTGAIILEGSPADGWIALEWKEEPLGGAALRDSSADDITGDTFAEATE